MAARVFDVVAIDRNTNQEVLWRIHGCSDSAHATSIANAYNARYKGVFLLGGPTAADGNKEAWVEVNANGQAFAHRPNAQHTPTNGLTDPSVADQDIQLINFHPEALRGLRTEIWKAILLAWLFISIFHGILFMIWLVIATQN